MTVVIVLYVTSDFDSDSDNDDDGITMCIISGCGSGCNKVYYKCWQR